MILDREPALILAALQALLALAVGFGLHITPEQVALVMAFAAAVAGLIVRQSVYSQETVAQMEANGELTGSADEGEDTV